MEEPETSAPPAYIFHLLYIALHNLDQNTFDPMPDENGNAAQYDLFLPASDAKMEEAPRFAEEHGDGGRPICKFIGCGKYDLPIREMTIIDISSLNNSAEMIARMSQEQVGQLKEAMKGFEYEYDLEDACRGILAPEETMNCSL